MKLHNLILAFIGLESLCGCSPDLPRLQNFQNKSAVDVSVYADGQEHRYSADAETLKLELHTWLQAGLDGFSTQSYIDYAPDVCISYYKMNSSPSKPWLECISVNFTEKRVVVNETHPKGGSQYVRDATEADRRFRAFILRCISEDKFKRAELEKTESSRDYVIEVIAP